MIKKLFNIKYLLIAAVAVVTLSTTVKITAADFLVDKDDIFALATPADGTLVKGASSIALKAYDDEQSQIPYELKLLDNNCGEQKSKIADGKIVGDQSSFTTINWNALEPTADQPTIPGGNYCLRICLTFLNNTAPYSVCDDRKIKIQTTDDQSAPVFTSIPAGTIIIPPAKPWEFDVDVKDQEHDPVTFDLLVKPDFLSIDHKTGVMKVDPALCKTGGQFVVWLSAADNQGNTAMHTFKFRVVSDTAFVTSNLNDTNNSVEVNTSSEIIIISPLQGTVFNGNKGNLIKWVASDAQGIDLVFLQYSADGKIWQRVNQYAGVNSTVQEERYDWDVSKLADGDYYLKLTVIDSKKDITEEVSGKFTVVNKTTGPTDTVPVLINIVPNDGDKITDLHPTLSADMVPSQGQQVDQATLFVQIDNQQLKNCVIENNKFNCKVLGDLKYGKHQAEAAFRDTAGKQATREWIFEITNNITPSAPVADATQTLTLLGLQIPRGTMIILGAICCITLLLLFIPWLLFGMWRRRSDSQTTTVVEQTPQYYYPPVDTTTYSYPAYPQPVAMTPVDNSAYTYTNTSDPITATLPSYPPPEPVITSTTTTTEDRGSSTPSWLQEQPVAPPTNPPAQPAPYGSYGYAAKEE